MPGPERGPSAYFRAGCARAGPQTPPAFFPPPHFLARLPPAALGVPPRPLPAPSRRLPLRDFVATRRRGCAPNKGSRLQAAPSRAARRGRWTGGGRLARPGLGDGGPVSLTGLPNLGRRHLPPNLRVTHGPAILANGIPGGSPTRAPCSLGPSEPPLPPFGEAVRGSIGRPLCPSDPGAAPSLPPRGPVRGSVGRAAAWRRGAPTWSAGGWGEAAKLGAGRLGCRGAVSRLAAGRGTVRTCVRVQVSVCVIQHSECTWGEEYSVRKRESGWKQLLTLYRIPFLSFPSRWADAADTRDGYTVSIICLARPEMSCQLTLAPSRVLA